jgi:hypothetical protein
MPRDAQQIGDTRAWLTKAALDLRAGEGDLTLEPPIPEDAMVPCPAGGGEGPEGFSGLVR